MSNTYYDNQVWLGKNSITHMRWNEKIPISNIKECKIEKFKISLFNKNISCLGLGFKSRNGQIYWHIVSSNNDFNDNDFYHNTENEFKKIVKNYNLTF